MATNPTSWQEQGPVCTPGELRGEEGTTMSHSSPARDKEAPRATPEEDVDVLEPGAELNAPQENQTIRVIETVDVTQMENEKSADISQGTPIEALEQIPKKLCEALSTEEEPEVDLGEEDFLPPPLRVLSGENCEKEEGFSSLEGEVSEWLGDAEVISDPTEDLAAFESQNSQEWPKTPQGSEPVYQLVDKIEINSPAEQNVDRSEAEHYTSEPVQHSFSDITSDDANTVNSPPYADESEEEEGASDDETSSLQQRNTLDLSCKACQPSCSATTETEHEEELLPQRQHELNRKGEIQEAAQQVFDQGSPPLSAVAMEPSNRGGEASRGCGFIAAVTERLSWVGERTERENKQTGEKEGQKESILEKIRPAEWSRSEGLLGCRQTIQTQETKTGKYSCSIAPKESTRMKNNMYDDSQRDNGVSPYRSMEGTAVSPGSPAPETPIEREMRRAIEREQSLRRSRGLPNPCTSPEYVEIPLRRGLLSQPITAKWSQNKDREFAGKKMQQEIHEEARREQDLVKSGKVPGFYDKGTVLQIKESKQLFEAFQAPRDSTFLVTAKVKTPSLSSESTEDLSLESQEDVKSRVSTLNNSHPERKPFLLNSTRNTNPAKDDSTLRGPGLSEGTSCQIIILENGTSVPAQKQNYVKAEAKAVNSGNPYKSPGEARWHDGLRETEQGQDEDVASKENPFFKLRSSTNLVKVKQDILESKEREMELRKMRVSLYGGMNGAVSSSRTEQTPPDVPGSSSKMGRGSSAG
uniref:A-kinase anchor protein 2 C-terminal domain-containing protein n=2 Tax=Kryptolebias marmoratus TaxID=37003 RepID=A0A3Q3B7U7_KRYMA